MTFPDFPTMTDLWTAQSKVEEAQQAAIPDEEYERLVQVQHQTEAAYLEGVDREITASVAAFLRADADCEIEGEAE
jgi:tryptophan 2,3-dioxygenase